MKNSSIYQMTLASMLCAIGIIIPMISPIKFVLEPASFTLASHVAIMIAMFISPKIAAFVAVGTTVGFLLGGFPITVVARAASQIVFVLIGSYMISRNESLIQNIKKFIPFSFFLSIIHAVCEVIVVIPFFFSGPNNSDFLYSVIVLVGVGTLIHSMIDFFIAISIFKILKIKKLPAA